MFHDSLALVSRKVKGILLLCMPKLFASVGPVSHEHSYVHHHTSTTTFWYEHEMQQSYGIFRDL